MKVLRIGIAGVALVSLVGCSMFGAKKTVDYRSDATQAQSLEVPPDLTAPGTDESYQVPRGDSDNAATGYNGPAGGKVLPPVKGVHMERDAAQRWLVVGDKAENIWPVVRKFWLENGLTIKSEEPAAGVMETDWAENRVKIHQGSPRPGDDFVPGNKEVSSGERDQYQTRLERGKDGASTEIYITHRGMTAVYSPNKKDFTWQASGNDPEKEAIMLQRLMERFGVSGAQAANDVAAAGAAASAVMPTSTADSVPDPAGTASLRGITDGSSIIVVNDPFDRTWRKVGLAIESASLGIEDKDREKGIYYLRPIKIEMGWFDSLLFWKSNLDTVNRYRVNVKDGGTSCEVSITDQNGASNKASKQMIEAIYKNINQ